MQFADINSQFCAKGGAYITDTSLHAGPYAALFANTETVIASMTCAGISGTLTSITIPQGCTYPFPGAGATALTLTSGSCTLINA